MARAFPNGVKVATSTTGTGTVDLGAAATGFRTFAQAVTASEIASADTVGYYIQDGAAWEIGTGTYTDAATDTLSRTLVASSTGSLLSLSGSATVEVVLLGSDISPADDNQIFNSSGTWTKPIGNYRFAIVRCWGGGGSGSKFDNTFAGGGGGGGFYEETLVPFADLGSTETVTVGAGGAGVTAADTVGNEGGISSFGSHCRAIGGAGGGRLLTNSGYSNQIVIYFGGGFDQAGRGPGSGQGSLATPNGLGINHIPGGGGIGGTTNDIGGNGANAESAGAGGGGGAMDSSPGPGSGGTSQRGGNGGAGAFDTNNATAGSQPGGGGGGSEDGTSGAGGAGRVQVICV